MSDEIDILLRDAAEGKRLDRDDVIGLLSLRDPDRISRLFEAARAARRTRFGDLVFVYGFVYFSNHCRNSCAFCGCRASNGATDRYRKTAEEIVSLSVDLLDEGAHLVDLTMGEDPHFLADGGRRLLEVIGDVRSAAPAGRLMISPGVVSPAVLSSVKDAGADWYACYQETYNPRLYGLLRPGQDFRRRLSAKLHAKRCGLLIEEGMMVGVGETLDDQAGSIVAMGALGAQQVRAMTFVPPAGACGSVLEELKAIAVMRLAYPERLIPASLDVQGLGGIAPRLAAGANVITSVIPPGAGLKGIASPSLGIESDLRSVSAVREEIESLGYRWAGRGEYEAYLEAARGVA